MPEIITLISCLSLYLTVTQMRHLSRIIEAMLCISGQVTMLGLSRWSLAGGSYRTVQRGYNQAYPWSALHWEMVKAQGVQADKVYLLAADDVVVSKAGKATHGVGRFYSSLAQRCIGSVAFLSVALLDVAERQAYPLQVVQHLPKPAEANGDIAPEPGMKRRRGRPPGSKNHALTVPVLSAELTQLQHTLSEVRQRISPTLKVEHVALDGAFGTYAATYAVQHSGFHIISKLRQNAALYASFNGPKPPRGPMPRYGAKLDYRALPEAGLCATTTEAHLRTQLYHAHLWHKDFPDLLNIAILVKTHLLTGKRAHVVLFSTDLTLSPDQLVDYYRLRFQIEFTFRDAKQHWGLEDFMNIEAKPVTNAVNLAFFMVNLSALLIRTQRQHTPNFSILDLKAQFRAQRYLRETILLLPFPPDPDLIERLWLKLSALGGIHTRSDLDDAA
jgi:putative transposase